MVDKQSWLPLAIAALGIVGTLLGSSMQHFWNVQKELSEEFEDRRRTAYVAFLQALDKDRVAIEQEAKAKSLLEDAKKEEKDTERAKTLKNEAQALQDEARNLRKSFELEGGAALRLIAVYGDKEVVEAYARYVRALDKNTGGEEAYGPCSTTWQEDVAIYQAIRKSSMGPREVVKPIDLAFSTLFCNPEKATDAQHGAPADR